MPRPDTQHPVADTVRDASGMLRFASGLAGDPHGPVLLDADEAMDFAAWLARVHGTTPAAEPGGTLTRLLAVFRLDRVR